MRNHQRVRINNNCTIKYNPDHVYVTQKILEKIPDKYLRGLEEINFYDDENYPIAKYVKGKPSSKSSRIDVFMGGVATSQKYSLMRFNILINPTIVDHIVEYLQPKSDDEDILSFRSGRYNPAWLYLGIWSPLLLPLKLGRYLYSKFTPFRLLIDAKIKQILNKHT